MRIALPSLGQDVVSRDTAQFPPGLSRYFAFLQVVGSDGRDSSPAHLNQSLTIAARGKRLFSVALSAGYDRKSGVLRLALGVKNIGIRTSDSRRSVVVADVTIGYRA